MRCHYYDAGRCRSCSQLDLAYGAQVLRKQELAQTTAPGAVWEPPQRSAQAGFRNKAKMVVAGTTAEPTLGILTRDGVGVDLQQCPLHEPAVVAALPVLSELVGRASLTPYSVPERRGELKHVLVTASPAGELMVRFVLRSRESVPRLRKHLHWLTERLPPLRVASANLLPGHVALTEGAVEIPLTAQQALPMAVGDVVTQLRPGAFFQTNSGVAAALYRTAARWGAQVEPTSVVDLYCGIGGFALHLARSGAGDVTGVEVSPDAVEGARAAAHAAGLAVRFETGDAGAARHLDADLVIVNPPRRGIGDLASRLETAQTGHVLYSSCNPATLARDLAAMPSLRPVRAQLFDMFPHNPHAEVLTLLRRR